MKVSGVFVVEGKVFLLLGGGKEDRRQTEGSWDSYSWIGGHHGLEAVPCAPGTDTELASKASLFMRRALSPILLTIVADIVSMNARVKSPRGHGLEW